MLSCAHQLHSPFLSGFSFVLIHYFTKRCHSERQYTLSSEIFLDERGTTIAVSCMLVTTQPLLVLGSVEENKMERKREKEDLERNTLVLPP